jgi:hypothetical protein
MDKITYEFDPFELLGIEKPKSSSDVNAALSDIADYVKTEILQFCGDGKSPVAGGQWKRSLSPEYKKLKEKISGSNFANMELTGEMLDALDARITSSGTIEVGIWGDQASKADGHNNFSGSSTLPPRQFIPNEDKGQTFKPSIISGMKRIAQSFFEDAG